MILIAILLQAAPPTLGAIGRQALPDRGCAAYLWSTDRALVAMASADPARLRVAVDGRTIDVDRSAQAGAGGFGFAATTDYAGGGVKATLDITIAPRADLTAGAAVPTGTLTVARDGGDTVVVPVAGLIGCV